MRGIPNCRNGHPLTDANIRWQNKNGRSYRSCATCKRILDNRANAKKRAVTAAKRAQRDAEIRRLHAEGQSQWRIKKQLGCGYDTIRSVIDPEYAARMEDKKADRRAGRRSSGLMLRHEAAMRIVAALSVPERYGLLAAVVWPESDLLETLGEAA